MGTFSKNKRRHNAYCAFCRTPRRISRKRNVSLANIVACALTSGIVMWLMWGEADPRAFVVFACLLGISEYFVQVRWRLSVVCRSCGFDPVLYVKNPSLAVEKVKAAIDRRRQSGRGLLARPLDLPTLTPERAKALALIEEAKENPGRLVSRNI